MKYGSEIEIFTRESLPNFPIKYELLTMAPQFKWERIIFGYREE